MTSIPPVKQCRACGELKAITEFYQRSNGYIVATCKHCSNAARRDNYKLNHSQFRAAAAERYRRDPQKVKARSAQYRRDNPRKFLAAVQRWQAEHPERMADYKAKYKDRRLASNRARYANDAEWRKHVRKNARQWRIDHPEERKIQHQRRRARMGDKHFTLAEWRAMLAWFGNACLKCGDGGKLTPDHVVPLSKGGANTIDNIQPLCFNCNSSKQAKTADYRDAERLRQFLEQL